MKYYQKEGVDKVYYRPAEVCKALMVSYQVLYNWARKAGFRPVGKRWARYSVSDVVKIAEARKEAGLMDEFDVSFAKSLIINTKKD